MTRTESTSDGLSKDVKSEQFGSDDSEIEPVVKKRKNSAFDLIMLDLKLKEKDKTKRTAIIRNKFLIPEQFFFRREQFSPYWKWISRSEGDKFFAQFTVTY